MGRILAIDYGQKRVGIAVTDPEKIIASSLATLHVNEIFDFLKQYVQQEDVEGFVVGQAKQMDSSDSGAARFIEPFVKKLKKTFPHLPVERMDERFTSKMAMDAMIQAGTKQKARRDKAKIDAISATIILQSYMEKPDRKF
ncbi:MAG: Holliday junction resolvase RuvX [Bacteroidales bacterium]